MEYQKDAYIYRKKIRRKQRNARIKGSALIAFSLALMLYSIPCFASSIWDSDSASGAVVSISSTVFSNDINDIAYVEDEAAAESGSSTPVREYDVAGYMVAETTGPGLLNDEEAVKSAKLRAQAVSVATAERNARMFEARYVNEPLIAQSTDIPYLAIAALVLSFVCAGFGFRMILHARNMQGRAIQAAYDSALRAV